MTGLPEPLRRRADDTLARMVEDADSDWPDRLLARVRAAPAVDESTLSLVKYVPATTDLSGRDLMLLRCLAAGMSTKQAAVAVGRSHETVKQQLTLIRYKLGAKTTLHACCQALRRGLIP